MASSARLVRKLVSVYPDQPVRRLLSVARRPGDVHALASLLRSLPTEVADVPAELADAFSHRLSAGPRLPFGPREPRAVLHLADTLEENLAGRSRQALRTNIRQARSLGIVARPITGADRDDVNGQAQARLAAHGHPVSTGPFHGDPRQIEVASFTASGTLLVMGAASCWGRWAVLEMFIRFSDLPETSPARYLTHLVLLEQLVQAGVRHLVAEETLRSPDGLRYQYHLLGYRPARVVGAPAARSQGR